MGGLVNLVVLVLSALLFSSVEAKSYKKGDNIPLISTKIGPYTNPSEVYMYYKLPFCKPDHKNVKFNMEDTLQGERPVLSPYTINFMEDVDYAVICEEKKSKKSLQKFADAIKEDYFFMMQLDGLPVWDSVGRLGVSRADPELLFPLLNTHLHFDIGYNDDKVVGIQISKEERDELPLHDPRDDTEVKFTYSVKWHRSELSYEDRMSVYTNNNYGAGSLEVHWLSIFNACGTVALLLCFLATILMKILHKDFLRYASKDELAALDDGDIDESGWKLVHADVFRFPTLLSLYCALLGCGCQMLLIFTTIFALGLFGTYIPYHEGNIFAIALLIYAITAGVSSFVSLRFYTQMGGTMWAWNTVLSMALLAVPGFLVWSFNNSVAWAYHSTAALPFLDVFFIFSLFFLLNIPLMVIGGIAGRRNAGNFNAPCRTSKVPRQIPPIPWYRTAPIQMLFAGFLPFSAIYIELYYMFQAAWGHRVYTIYYIAFIVFCILVFVTSFITIALTYFQLVNEDYRWWWQSFLNGGSTGLFVFMYCVYFYMGSDMHGFLQTSFFFGYMFLVCYAIFLMLGFVGAFTSLVFVRYIYRNIHSD